MTIERKTHNMSESRRSHKMLLEFYLRHNVYGCLGEFNKQYFPIDWEIMRTELEQLIEDK